MNDLLLHTLAQTGAEQTPAIVEKLKFVVMIGVVSGNGKYSTLRFFNCAQWPKFSTTYLGFASP